MAARAYIGGRGPVAPPTADRPLSPPQRATGPCRPLGLFFQGPHCEFEQKKFTLKACRPMGGDRGYF